MDKSSSGSNDPARYNPGVPSKWFLAVMIPIGIGVALLAFLAWRQPWHKSRPPGVALEQSAADHTSSTRSPSPSRQDDARRVGAGGGRSGQPVAPGPEGAAEDPTTKARRLVDALTNLNPAAEPLTPENFERNRQNLVSLVDLNVDAIPAIEDYFASGQNVDFGTGPATNLVNAPTLRLALLKILLDFAAPDNEQLEARLLQTAADPDEVLLLARQLATAVPDQYHDIILAAARTALESVQQGRFPGRDPAPLVKLIAKYETAEQAREKQ